MNNLIPLAVNENIGDVKRCAVYEGVDYLILDFLLRFVRFAFGKGLGHLSPKRFYVIEGPCTSCELVVEFG